MENPESTAKEIPWFIKRAGKITAFLFWVILIVGYQWYASANNLSPMETVKLLLAFMQTGFWGPLVYIGLYIFRPLILFPSTVLTLAGGFVFGSALGILYTIIASNLSSALAYFIGRFFGQGIFDGKSTDHLIERYAALE